MKLSTLRSSRLFLLVWLIVGLAISFTPERHSLAADPPPYVVEKNVMVPMRDGVRLGHGRLFPGQGRRQTGGQIPRHSGAHSVQQGNSLDCPSPFVKHGYVVVFQDTRGRYASEGVWHMMTDDVNDGYDTAQWLVHQPWSDGGFGMVGTSYVGGTQHAMAESNPPGLKALIPVDAVANAGYFGMRNGGAFELRFFNWVFTMGAPLGSREAQDPAARSALEEAAKHVREYLAELPLRKGTTPLKLAPEYEDWLVFAMGHGENDGYWKQPGFDVVDQTSRYKDVPVYLIGGWYDSWALQTTMSYMALARAKHGPVKMILDPGSMAQHMHHAHGQTDFGPQAAIDSGAFHLRWYDRWLKGADNGVERDAPVKIFVMGGGSERKPRTACICTAACGATSRSGRWRALTLHPTISSPTAHSPPKNRPRPKQLEL